jgi:hypothetical protein
MAHHRINRRQFVQTVGIASGIGALGSKPGAVGEMSQGAPAQTANAASEFPKPTTLRDGAQLDSRFPVSFATPVSESLRLVMEYFTALNQRDAAAIARTLHFPFAIYETIEPIVVQSAADFVANPPPSLNATGKGKSRILQGSYDLLESINVHLYCPIGTAIALTFTRYTPDGHRQLVCDGIYSVTNNDGRWAIQMASTIVHEVDFIGVTYPDAEAADIRGNQNYLAAFGYRNEKILNDAASSRGSYERPLPVGTRVASVSFGYGPRERSRDAREGRPMNGWRTKGVKTRRRRVRLHARSPGTTDYHPRDARQGPHPRRLPPVHGRRLAHFRDAECRHPDLQGRRVGEWRRARSSHPSRSLELAGKVTQRFTKSDNVVQAVLCIWLWFCCSRRSAHPQSR